jgi:SOS-response transcriptional repressor LexA
MNSIGKIIATYRRKAHLSQIELAKKLSSEGNEVTNKAVSSWEKGRAEPGARTFLYICHILERPDCVEAFFGSNPADPMAVLNDEGKAKVLAYIDSLVHPVSYAKESVAADVIPFPTDNSHALKKLHLYDTRVSAGTGNFLDSDYYTTVDVDEEKAKDADFAVTISGDSMEPAFHDHDMVLIHQQDTLENGEIGIFALNGNAYIKKFKNDRKGTFLISLNKKYDPIPIHPDTDSFKIFGKVCQ